MEGVKQWAMEVVGIDEEDADKLVRQKIDGRALHTLTEAKLERCGMPIGPAGLFMEAMEGLGGGGSSAASAGRCCCGMVGVTVLGEGRGWGADVVGYGRGV